MTLRLSGSATLALLGLISAPNLMADSGVNLTGQIVGSPSVSMAAGGGANITFDVQITNTGSSDANGKIRLKPILVPEKTSTGWPEHGGRVLDASDVTISLGASKSTTVTYAMAMPTVPRASYFLAAIINSNGSMTESSLLDNVTDLVPVGDFQVTVAPAPVPLPADAAVLDFVSSNGAAMEVSAGTIKHELNTYSLSASKAQPDFGAARMEQGLDNNSGELFARFMFADIKTRKVYTVIYEDDYARTGWSAANPEKFWFLVTWHNVEKLLDGRYKQHDTYSETTRYDGIPPGDYKYLVLINSHDFPETDVHNNLSVSDISIRGARPKAGMTQMTRANGIVTSEVALPELWVVGERGSTPSTDGIGWMTDYTKASLVSAQSKADTSWAKLPAESKSLNGDRLVPMKASLESMDTVGVRSGGISYEVSSIPMSSVFGTGSVKGELPVTYFVRDAGQTPKAEFAPASLEVEDTYEGLVASAPQKVTLSNSGNSELRWKALGLPTWLSVEPKEGTIAAGESAELKLTIDPNPLNRGDSYSTELQIMTNIGTGAEGIRKIPVDLTLDLTE